MVSMKLLNDNKFAGPRTFQIANDDGVFVGLRISTMNDL